MTDNPGYPEHVTIVGKTGTGRSEVLGAIICPHCEHPRSHHIPLVHGLVACADLVGPELPCDCVVLTHGDLP